MAPRGVKTEPRAAKARNRDSVEVSREGLLPAHDSHRRVVPPKRTLLPYVLLPTRRDAGPPQGILAWGEADVVDNPVVAAHPDPDVAAVQDLRPRGARVVRQHALAHQPGRARIDLVERRVLRAQHPNLAVGEGDRVDPRRGGEVFR